MSAALDALLNARVVFWSCPVGHIRPPFGTLMVTVEWDDAGVAHCTRCPMTSDLAAAHRAWCYQ